MDCRYISLAVTHATGCQHTCLLDVIIRSGLCICACDTLTVILAYSLRWILRFCKGNFTQLFPKFVMVLCIMSSSHLECELYNIKKFDGMNFSLWKEQIHDVLI